MKKKLILIVSVAMIAAVSMTLAMSGSNSSKASLLMQNIEALANGENGGGNGGGGGTNPPANYTCYNYITLKNGSSVRFCGTCTFIQNATYDNATVSSCRMSSL